MVKFNYSVVRIDSDGFSHVCCEFRLRRGAISYCKSLFDEHVYECQQLSISNIFGSDKYCVLRLSDGKCVYTPSSEYKPKI